MTPRSKNTLLRIWLPFGLAWLIFVGVMLRVDQPATILAHYYWQSWHALPKTTQEAAGIVLPSPGVGAAKQDLFFFLLVGLGTPVLLWVMGRAASWAAGGPTSD